MPGSDGKSKKRIGELLIERGYLTKTQLDQALQHQRSTGEFVGTMLLRMGAVTPEMLLETFSEQFGIPSRHLDQTHINWDAAKLFPSPLLTRGTCFPIQADAESVTVAIINPLDAVTLSDVEQAAGVRTVKLVLVLERELHNVLQIYKRRRLQAGSARLSGQDNG